MTHLRWWLNVSGAKVPALAGAALKPRAHAPALEPAQPDEPCLHSTTSARRIEETCVQLGHKSQFSQLGGGDRSRDLQKDRVQRPRSSIRSTPLIRARLARASRVQLSIARRASLPAKNTLAMPSFSTPNFPLPGRCTDRTSSVPLSNP